MADSIQAQDGVSPRITAVIVLYKRTAEESEAFLSYREILRADADLAQNFALLVYDNSPQAQTVPQISTDGGAQPLPVAYVHDAENGGLAPAYNQALQLAEGAGHDWLLLLDQDTTLTREFFYELVDCTRRLEPGAAVAAIVPKLVSGGVIFSPEEPLLYQIRHPSTHARHRVDASVLGVQARALSAYNSAASLRVSALRAIGGFPSEYWLDYLDHAVFHALSRRGYRVYVMRAMLQHKPSQQSLDAMPLWRHRNHLAAQSLFVTRNGSRLDRLVYRLYLLRMARMMLHLSSNPRLAAETLLQALLLRKRADKPGQGQPVS